MKKLIIAVTAAFLSIPVVAHEHTVWDKLARCESSSRWNINTGNGFYGGLQFTSGTWKAYGGAMFASRADLASKSQQIAVAKRVLTTGFGDFDPQGPGAWPKCSKRVGLTKGA
jgi:resuscitation-promoting factor RpfA